MKWFMMALCSLYPLATHAQVDIRINIPLLTVRFEAPPPLVVVAPGIQVVPEQSEEIFFTGGVYWTRRDGRWFRSRDHRGGWVVAEERGVPPGLARMPPGRYRHWRAEERAERGKKHGHGRGEER